MPVPNLLPLWDPLIFLLLFLTPISSFNLQPTCLSRKSTLTCNPIPPLEFGIPSMCSHNTNDMCLYPLLIQEGRYCVSLIVGSVAYTRKYTFKRYHCPVPFSGRERRREERRDQSEGDSSLSTEVHSSAWHVKSPSAGPQGPSVNKLMITHRESGGWDQGNKFGG